jgi:hypothetical protein
MAYRDQLMDLVARTNRGLMNIYAYKSHTDRLLDLRVGYFNESRFARDEGFKNAFIFASLADGDYLLAVDNDGQTVTNVGCYLYDFRASDPDYYRLTTPFTGAVTLLFSTFNGTVGLPPEWQDATPVNAPAGARDDVNLFAGTGQEFTRSVTGITELIGPTFDGVLWAYALDGVWYYVDKGKPSFDGYAYRLNGTNQYWRLDTPFQLDVGDVVELTATLEQFSNFPIILATTLREDFRVFIGSTGAVNTEGFTRTDTGDTLLTAGKEYRLIFRANIASTLDTIGRRGSVAGNFLTGIIKNLKITRNNNVIFDLPLTDIDQGATQLDLVSGHPATAIAYNEDNWEQQIIPPDVYSAIVAVNPDYWRKINCTLRPQPSAALDDEGEE